MQGNIAELRQVWQNGYSISELWGNGEPISRGDQALETEHLLLWGILSIVEDQVGPSAGHRYLRDRLWNRNWIALGFLNQSLSIVPPIKDAKFGRKPSAIGDGTTNYVNARIVHAQPYSRVLMEMASVCSRSPTGE
jgi:hypothetical protein